MKESEIISELLNYYKLNNETELSTKIIIDASEVSDCFRYLKSKFPSTSSKIISKVMQKYII